MNIVLQGVSKRYQEHVALAQANLQAESIRCLALVGPSGGGKSTLLRLLAGLEMPDTGEVLINGQELPRDEASLRRYRRSIGVVFQSYNLFPHLTALENVVLPLIRAHGRTPEQARRKAAETLERFRLADHSGKRPAELSGGQNQRVAIARAIAHEPQLLLFDEPTSALDPDMAAEVLELIETLLVEERRCIIVTHQMSFARRASDQTVFVANGSILEHLPSAQFFHKPNNEQAQAFLERALKY